MKRRLSSGRKRKNESILADIREELENEQEIDEQAQEEKTQPEANHDWELLDQADDLSVFEDDDGEDSAEGIVQMFRHKYGEVEEKSKHKSQSQASKQCVSGYKLMK